MTESVKMGKKDKNKLPAVDNSPPVSPYIDPELQKKVLNELTRGFEWYFPSVHSPYREFIARWYLPNSFKTLLKRRDNHLKKLKNPKETFKDILKNKVKQCEVLLSVIRDKWIEHDLELTDGMKTFKPFEYKPQNGNHLQKAKKNIGKGGRPTDPKIAEKKRQLGLDYYSLTEKKGFNKKKAIKELEKKYPNWKKSTIEKYIK